MSGSSPAPGVRIQVRSVFEVRGHGAVLVGHPLAGVVRVGQRTAPLVLDEGPARRLEVVAVQQLHASEPGGTGVGLVFRERPRLEALAAALPPGTILVLETGEM